MEYIATPKKGGCFFCETSEEDPSSLFLGGDPAILFLLNRFPYNPGHILVAPRYHTGEYENLPDEIGKKLEWGVRMAIRILKEVMAPSGFNVGLNLGRTAGAGVVDHIHYHVVPRWEGDTNFMPILAETKVIPEHLQKTVEKLKPHFQSLFPSP